MSKFYQVARNCLFWILTDDVVSSGFIAITQRLEKWFWTIYIRYQFSGSSFHKLLASIPAT